MIMHRVWVSIRNQIKFLVRSLRRSETGTDKVHAVYFTYLLQYDTLKADSHIACRAHAASMTFPCHAVQLRV